jgi:hypothetical protein
VSGGGCVTRVCGRMGVHVCNPVTGQVCVLQCVCVCVQRGKVCVRWLYDQKKRCARGRLNRRLSSARFFVGRVFPDLLVPVSFTHIGFDRVELQPGNDPISKRCGRCAEESGSKDGKREQRAVRA